MTGTIRVKAAVLDKQRLILYKEDASTVTLEQGDERIRPILDQITPVLNAGGVAIVELTPEVEGPKPGRNEYARFQKKTNGLVKLFRVAKSAVAHLFGSDEERAEILADTTIGQIPTAPAYAPAAAKQTSTAAISEIMSHAQPVTDRKFQETETAEHETMIAVVGKGNDAKVIPGVEALKGQMAHANSKLGSPKGVQRLLERLGKVIDKRGHSVQDVMRFLERGDLPIADDGSILAYKVLRKHPAQPDTFVDCRTRNIPQKVGSVVRVAEHLVDLNRRNECSNGLHIARRGYIRNFSGDVCVLIKLAPEDVVTVPHNDPNKVRVCAYHIIGLLSDTEYAKLRTNQPMTTTPDTQQMLAAAIKGQHVGQLEEVRVTGQHGTGVQIKQLVRGKVEAPARPTPVSQTEAPKARAIPDPEAPAEPAKPVLTAAPVDPKTVSQKVVSQKAEPTRSQLAAELIGKVADLDLPFGQRKEAAEALVALKKRTKVGYGVLGLSVQQERMLQEMLEAKPPEPAKPRTRQEEARYLANTMMTGKTIPARENAARQLVKLKKKSKVSYEALGLKAGEIGELGYLTDPKTNGNHLAPSKAQATKAEIAKQHGAPAKVVESMKAPKPKKVMGDPPADANRKAKALFYFAVMKDPSYSDDSHKLALRLLLEHKKNSKLGWSALGISEEAAKTIEALVSRDN